jgi:two-component system, cell cycle response regulator DivK
LPTADIISSVGLPPGRLETGSFSVQRESILIVDDNELNSKLIKALLTKEGYQVQAAATAAETREMLTTFRPQLILMDVQLPDANGLDLARQIKADPQTGSLIIVALSAYTSPGDAEKAKAAGCDGYLSKPVDARTLPTVLRRYLDAST